MTEVIVYTKNICPYCVKAKHLLQRKGVEFKEINLSNDPEEYEKLKDKTNFYTVPQIFIGQEFIGGCDDLYELEEKGELDNKLNNK